MGQPTGNYELQDLDVQTDCLLSKPYPWLHAELGTADLQHAASTIKSIFIHIYIYAINTAIK